MLEKIIQLIEQYSMLQQGDGVVVGLSGGPDSCCLLHVLHSFSQRFGLQLYAVHLNHMIRDGEAERDEEFSRQLAASMSIPFFSKRIDVNAYAADNGLSSEEAGRLLRYELFEKIARSNGARKIALAHNMNDQTETMIMRLFRGTGIRGIVGIRPIREERFIRPILCCKREEIEEYCRVHRLNPVIDSTNAQGIYTRNRIRLEVVPYIREHFNPNIDESFYRLSGILKDEDDYLELAAQAERNRLLENGWISCEAFTQLHPALQKRLVRLQLQHCRGDLNGIENKHIAEIITFIHKSQTGKRIMLPGGFVCVVEYGSFQIRGVEHAEIPNFASKLTVPGRTVVTTGISEVYTVITKIFELNNKNLIDKQFVKFFDYDKMKYDLYFRNRRDGDHISPKGMGGSKKLKELFIDRKIPKAAREAAPLVVLAEDEHSSGDVLWILNIRDSKNCKIDGATKTVLEISILRGEINE